MIRTLSIGLMALALSAGMATAGTILIINGASVTSETGTTSKITTNLKALHEAVGNTVTVADGLPADLSPFDQLWDIRFSNNSPITTSQEADFVAFLQGGGGMFVMGENSSFPTRNASVISLIAAAGGGSIAFASVGSTQTVIAPFDGPNAVSQVSYAAPGGVNGAGTGQFITSVGTVGTGVAFGVGDLTNAPLGALTAIFDVNFMEGDRGDDQQNLLKNLIGFVEDEVDPPAIPVPAALPLALSGLGLLAMVRRRA